MQSLFSLELFANVNKYCFLNNYFIPLATIKNEMPQIHYFPLSELLKRKVSKNRLVKKLI
jgi:hypothetical protein